MIPARIHATVEFAVELPDDEVEQDKRADEISDAIVTALTRSHNLAALGVSASSYSVIDWMEERP